LQLHGGLLFAAQHDDLAAFDGDGAGAALDGFESIFDLEDVAVGGEDWRWVSWCGRGEEDVYVGDAIPDNARS
jgi:hypothetical protein